MLAHHEGAQALREGSISQAWLTAVLSRADRVPSLESLFNPRVATIEDGIATLKARIRAAKEGRAESE